MQAMALQSITQILPGKKYTISSKEELMQLAQMVNSGQDCKGATITLLNDIRLNPYHFYVNQWSGLLIVRDTNYHDLFGIGTGITGHYQDQPDEEQKGKIYYGGDLAYYISRLSIGSYSKGIVSCGATQYTLFEWEPIGTMEHPFKGTFNGNNKKIYGLFTMSEEDKNYRGLFGYVDEGGKIYKVLVEDGMSAGKQHVGGIIGYGKKCRIESCHNLNTILGVEYTGGIVGGLETGLLYKCTNGNYNDQPVAIISGSRYGGGIVGGMTNSESIKCVNHGFVTTATLIEVGGIAGIAIITAQMRERCLCLALDCHNTGQVGCVSFIIEGCTGGIIGVLQNFSTVCQGLVKKCTNTGHIRSTTEGIGGIVGYAENGWIQQCKNSGLVEGLQKEGVRCTKGIGGILGYAYNGTTVIGCNNTGGVKAYGIYIGGVVGGAYAEHYDGFVNKNMTIKDCYNEGTVECWIEEGDPSEFLPDTIDTTGSCVGGVVGYIINSIYEVSKGYLIRVYNCYNKGSIYNYHASNTGGVVGYCKDARIENSYNLGTVRGTKDVCGVVGNVTNYNRQDDRVANCYNSGNIYGTENVGGVCGSMTGEDSIISCYSKKDCVLNGLGGLDEVLFEEWGTIEGRQNGLVEALNIWIQLQTDPEVYIPWIQNSDNFPEFEQLPTVYACCMTQIA